MSEVKGKSSSMKSLTAVAANSVDVDHPPGFLGFSPEYLMRPTYFAEVLRKMRRAYLSVVNPEYVQKSIEQNRKGECHRCGMCCQLVYKCPFLGIDAESLPFCRIYGDLRPGTCKNYPFDRVDSEIEQCGFKFK